MKTTITTSRYGRQRVVVAEYDGGAYIDLHVGFDKGYPVEVINVYDYAAGEPEIPQPDDSEHASRGAVRQAVVDWIESNDEDWPEWYEGYLENS
jgi:hypothetical protein